MEAINTPVKIAIVDDHQIVIDGIKALLNSSANFTIVADHTSPAALMESLFDTEVDILITDIMMPEMNGRTLAKKVKENFPHIKILALSMSGEGNVVNEMINEADISGYALKNISKDELTNALMKIAKGGIYFDTIILDEMLRASEATKIEPVYLTIRELEIIRLIEKELSNKEIAAQLFISERTVETHRKNIFRKTGKNTVIGLVKYAYDHKLLDQS